MSSFYGITVPKKVCRACLNFDDGVKYCKMKKRKRYFTRLIDIQIDSSSKNWLCIECAFLISKMLTLTDKVVKVNSELNRLARNQTNSLKINLHIIAEARQLVNFTKLSFAQTSFVDNFMQSSPCCKLFYSQEKMSASASGEFGDGDFVKTESGDFSGKLDYSPSYCDTEFNDEFVFNDNPSGENTLDRSIMELNIEGIKIEDESDPIYLPPIKRIKTGETNCKWKMKSVSVTDELDENENSNVLNEQKMFSKNSDKVSAIALTVAQQFEDHRRLAEDKSYLNAIYKCTLCYKGFSYRETYQTHMDVHKKSFGDHKCSICHKYLKSRASYQSHMLNHSKKYKCTRCDFTRTWRNPVVEHYMVAHESDIMVSICDLCGKEFIKKSQLRHHLRYTHKESARLKCKHCEKTFKSYESLRRHLVTQHLDDRPESEKRFSCSVCGDRFRNSTFLRIHQVKHSTSRDFYCAECDTYFKSYMILKAHMRTSSKHIDPGKLVPCPNCPYRTVNKKELLRHIERRHLRITNFQCSQCPKGFYANNSLKRHFKEIHEGLKPPKIHVCDVCGLTFAAKKTLINHKNTHTGDKPFACKECDAKFGGTGTLYTHV